MRNRQSVHMARMWWCEARGQCGFGRVGSGVRVAVLLRWLWVVGR